MITKAVCCFLCAVGCAGFAAAADEPVPDLSGVWESEAWSTEAWAEEPPYTAAGRAAQETWAADPAADPSLRCLVPLGRIISAPLPHEIIQEEDRITILYEYEHQVRRVFMDGRDHPDDAYPTLMGHSIGWWEGDTLVVDTVDVEAGLFRPQGIPYTQDLHMVERFTLLDGGTRMQGEIEIRDPEYYREPWSVTKTYRRTDEELKDYECIVREHLTPAP